MELSVSPQVSELLERRSSCKIATRKIKSNNKAANGAVRAGSRVAKAVSSRAAKVVRESLTNRAARTSVRAASAKINVRIKSDQKDDAERTLVRSACFSSYYLAYKSVFQCLSCRHVTIFSYAFDQRFDS